MKLFKTSYIQVVKDCQVYFGFDLPMSLLTDSLRSFCLQNVSVS